MVNHCSIDKEIARSFHPDDFRVFRFYILSKIHQPRNSGRPTVSSCGPPTEGFSYFVIIHLGSLVRKIPSYIENTMGETENPLHLLMNSHQSDYCHRLPNKPVVVHFITPSHTCDDISRGTVVHVPLRD